MHVQAGTRTPGKHQGPTYIGKARQAAPCPAIHESLRDKAPGCQSPRPRSRSPTPPSRAQQEPLTNIYTGQRPFLAPPTGLEPATIGLRCARGGAGGLRVAFGRLVIEFSPLAYWRTSE